MNSKSKRVNRNENKTGAIASMDRGLIIQRKLHIGAENDYLEKEADEMADRVMRMPEDGLIQRKCTSFDQEEEGRVQRKSLATRITPFIQQKSSESGVASDSVSKKINSSRGSGRPLTSSTQNFMENRFGSDFSNVRIHTGSEASDLSRNLNAKAFTVGRDVFFNNGQYAPGTSRGKHLLAHELTHVVQQDTNELVQRRVLNRAESRTAIAHGRTNYDQMSVRIIQNITGLVGGDIDGIFGRITARSVSDWQTLNGIAADDGRVLQDSLDLMIANRVAAGAVRRNEAIHLVTDFFNLDITTDTLTVYSEPGASTPNPAPPPPTFPANTTFESGNLRVIRIGTGAFTNATTLRATIQRELNRPAPAGFIGPAAPTPAVLNRTQVRSAIRYTKRYYQDPRSIRALQGRFPGVAPTGIIDADLVQRIAQEQNNTGTLVVDGKVGRNTLEHFFVQLRDSGNQNVAMRLVMDFYNMPDYNNLLTIYYQNTGGYTGYAGTSRNARGPVRIRVRRALYMPFVAMVHTLRHELEHVNQHRKGILSRHTREFLSESTEIISFRMPHETLFDVSTPDASGTGLANVSGFQNDVDRMITRWNQMPVNDRRTYWPTLVRARRIIRRRIARTYAPTQATDQAEWAAATPAQRAALLAILVTVNAAVRP